MLDSLNTHALSGYTAQGAHSPLLIELRMVSTRGVGMATIRDMTIEQLRRMINQQIEERLSRLAGQFNLELEASPDDEEDARTWEEVQADIERDRWTPPPGAKSSLELLREDRER